MAPVGGMFPKVLPARSRLNRNAIFPTAEPTVEDAVTHITRHHLDEPARTV